MKWINNKFGITLVILTLFAFNNLKAQSNQYLDFDGK